MYSAFISIYWCVHVENVLKHYFLLYCTSTVYSALGICWRKVKKANFRCSLTYSMLTTTLRQRLKSFSIFLCLYAGWAGWLAQTHTACLVASYCIVCSLLHKQGLVVRNGQMCNGFALLCCSVMVYPTYSSSALPWDMRYYLRNMTRFNIKSATKGQNCTLLFLRYFLLNLNLSLFNQLFFPDQNLKYTFYANLNTRWIAYM